MPCFSPPSPRGVRFCMEKFSKSHIPITPISSQVDAFFMLGLLVPGSSPERDKGESLELRRKLSVLT